MQPRLALGIAVIVIFGGVTAALSAPGRFLPDSLDMYNQALLDRYTDWHSPILVGLWGLTDLPPEFVLLVFVIIVAVAAMLLVACETTVSWAVVTVVLTCAWPLTLGVLTTVSKDAWFAGFFLSAAAASAYAIQRVGRQRWALVGIAGAGFWLAVAARPNAIVPVAAVIALGWPLANGGEKAKWLSRRGLKRLGLAVVVSGLLVLSQRVYSSVVVEPEHVHPEQPGYQFDLASLSLRTGRMLLPDSSLTPGTDLDDIRLWFDEGDGSYLWFFSARPPIRFAVSADAVAELREAWLQAIRRHPLDMLQHRLAYARALLNLDRPAYGVYDRPSADPAAWGFDFRLHQPFVPWFYSWIDRSVATETWFGYFRAWIWAAVLSVMGASRRGRRSVAVRTLVAAGITNLLTFMAAATSSGFRYAWFTMLCALLTLGIGLSWVTHWALDRRHRWISAKPGRPDRGPAEGADLSTHDPRTVVTGPIVDHASTNRTHSGSPSHRAHLPHLVRTTNPAGRSTTEPRGRSFALAPLVQCR